MTILQHSPSQDDILDFLDQSIQMLVASGADQRYVLLGPEAVERFRQALAIRLSRKPKRFGTYNHVPVILDPFRGDQACVLPEPLALKGGFQAITIPV